MRFKPYADTGNGINHVSAEYALTCLPYQIQNQFCGILSQNNAYAKSTCWRSHRRQNIMFTTHSL